MAIGPVLLGGAAALGVVADLFGLAEALTDDTDDRLDRIEDGISDIKDQLDDLRDLSLSIFDAVGRIEGEVRRAFIDDAVGAADGARGRLQSFLDLPADERSADERNAIRADAREAVRKVLGHTDTVFDGANDTETQVAGVGALIYALAIRLQIEAELNDGAYAALDVKEDIEDTLAVLRSVEDVWSAASAEGAVVSRFTTPIPNPALIPPIVLAEVVTLNSAIRTDDEDIVLLVSLTPITSPLPTPSPFATEEQVAAVINAIVARDMDELGVAEIDQMIASLEEMSDGERFAGDDAVAADDDFTGTDGNDLLLGFGGDDRLDGGDDRDVIRGGDGDDTMIGGAGTDVIRGDEGADVARGGANGDRIFGDAGADTIRGGGGDDEIFGGRGGDALFGNGGDDLILGESGSDAIKGGAGDDDLQGGVGNDMLRGGVGGDSLSGGDGEDDLFGGSGDDDLRGGDDDDRLVGGEGSDKLSGEDGADRLAGKAGDDRLDAGAGDDVLNGGASNDELLGGDGRDRLIGGRGDDVMSGGEGRDLFIFATENGDDRITDFEDGVDRLSLQGRTIDGRSVGFDDLSIVTVGDETIVQERDLTITLEGVADGQLDADDFLFS